MSADGPPIKEVLRLARAATGADSRAQMFALLALSGLITLMWLIEVFLQREQQRQQRDDPEITVTEVDIEDGDEDEAEDDDAE